MDFCSYKVGNSSFADWKNGAPRWWACWCHVPLAEVEFCRNGLTCCIWGWTWLPEGILLLFVCGFSSVMENCCYKAHLEMLFGCHPTIFWLPMCQALFKSVRESWVGGEEWLGWMINNVEYVSTFVCWGAVGPWEERGDRNDVSLWSTDCFETANSGEIYLWSFPSPDYNKEKVDWNAVLSKDTWGQLNSMMRY